MSKDRKNNSVTFNLLDDFELELLNHAERKNPRTNRKRNFSKYVKDLIYQDLMLERQQESTDIATNERVVNSTTSPPIQTVERQIDHVENVILDTKPKTKDDASKDKLNSFFV